MDKIFNVTGACDSKLHYMVNLDSRMKEIKKLIAAGAYL